MIYIFSGDDTKTKYANYEKFVHSLGADAEVFYITRNNFNKDQIESLCSGSSLFFGKFVVCLEDLLIPEETQGFILERLGKMETSLNSFVFLEGKLPKAILDEFKKARAQINVFELPKEKYEKFDNFLLANAFGNRDKLNLWIYFRQAMDVGVGMEELVGVLFWKAKDMTLKKNFSKYSVSELNNFSSKIAYLLPRARGAGTDPEAVFEKFILEAL